MTATPLQHVLQRLKEGTEKAHLEAERRVRILDADATQEVYRHYLEKMLGFHAPLEAQLAANTALEQLGFDAPSRRKQSWILQDLQALAAPLEAPECQACPLLPNLSTLPRALGCAYVLEGSTLGGQYILRNLGGELPAWRGKATAFLEGYGRDTGPQWKAMGSVLARGLADAAQLEEAVTGACETFETLIVWLDRD